MAERTTKKDVEFAFYEWLALMGGQETKASEEGKYRIGHDGFGRTRIERLIGDSGGIHVVARGMPAREFCDAVDFLGKSLLEKKLRKGV